MELAKIDPKDYGIEQANAATIELAFQPKITERDGYALIYGQLIVKPLTIETCKEAKELRLKLVKVRTGISDIHKSQKAYFLAAGKFVDAWKTKETAPVEQMEETLSGIETHFVKIEAERIAKLETDRKAEILSYSEVVPGGLGSLDESIYNNYLTGVKIAYSARIEAEKQAETLRIKAIEDEKEAERLRVIENERIRVENEKLKAEAAEKERLAQERIAKEESDRKEKQAEFERILKLESEKAEKELKKQKELAEREALRLAEIASKELAELQEKQKAIEAKAETERKAQADIIAKQKAKADFEAKQQAELIEKERAKAEAERRELEAKIAIAKQQEAQRLRDENQRLLDTKQAEAKAAKAPDKMKLIVWITKLNISTPEMSSDAAKATLSDINAKFEGFKLWANSQIEKL